MCKSNRWLFTTKNRMKTKAYLIFLVMIYQASLSGLSSETEIHNVEKFYPPNFIAKNKKVVYLLS